MIVSIDLQKNDFDKCRKEGEFEPRCEKTGLRDFRPGQEQTGLYSFRK